MKRGSIGMIAAALSALALAGGGGLLLADRGANAADHNEPASRVGNSNNPNALDRSADIADIYAWHTSDSLNLVLTLEGPHAPTVPPRYDRDVLHKILISNDANIATPEIVIRARFGRDADGNVGVQIENVPGAAGTIVGPINQLLASGPVKAQAGLFDDPFFFDSAGLQMTRVAGDLRFNSTRDFFAAANDIAIVIQLPLSAVANGSNKIGVWSTTDRIRQGL